MTSLRAERLAAGDPMPYQRFVETVQSWMLFGFLFPAGLVSHLFLKGAMQVVHHPEVGDIHSSVVLWDDVPLEALTDISISVRSSRL